MVQTTYDTLPTVGMAGLIGDMQHHDQISRVASEALPFGVFVAKETARPAGTVSPGACKLPDDTGDQILGVTVFEHNKDNRSLSGILAIPSGDLASILRQGLIWVRTEKAVDEGDPVFVRHTANGGNTALGFATDTDDAGNTSLLAGARFANTTAAAGIALVELRGSVNAMS